ncbi:hypothetical protein ACLOJK_013211 [Asimina triloba]
MKTTKMSGFLCQSPAATAVCMNPDPRSMIVARRHDRSNASDRTRLIDLKYGRLAGSRRLALGDKRAVTVSSLAKRDRKQSTAARNVPSLPPSSSSTASAPTAGQVFQVVVMRVSLHCQGCAGKVKKHLSKMEGPDWHTYPRVKEGCAWDLFFLTNVPEPSERGTVLADFTSVACSSPRTGCFMCVNNTARKNPHRTFSWACTFLAVGRFKCFPVTYMCTFRHGYKQLICDGPRILKICRFLAGVTSFSIDLESKRVTVMGHVSPAGVLESISKVKRAEFWPPSSNGSP